MSESDLESQRREIDRIDAELVRLLNERARVSQEIARRKAESGASVFVASREHQVISNVLAANRGPLKSDHLRSIYREVFSSSRDLQRRLKVAYLGPEATFTHQAALRLFGESTDLVPVSSIRDVFLETERGGADFGVVPVENSTEGTVQYTLDTFIDMDLKIVAELSLPIVQNLMARIPREKIERIYSHPQALAQCRGWLAAHFPRAEQIQTLSTAGAAEQAAQDPVGAAIAPALAAEKHELEILEAGIQDLSNNITRFLAIGFSSPEPTGQDKTAAIISIKDRVGALYDLMKVFAERGISLSNIQSRPSRRKAWDYMFFVEMEGHADDANLKSALEALEEQVEMVKVLGSWPRPEGRS